MLRVNAQCSSPETIIMPFQGISPSLIPTISPLELPTSLTVSVVSSWNRCWLAISAPLSELDRLVGFFGSGSSLDPKT